MGQFGAYIGADGSVYFQVSENTAKGAYRFLSVRDSQNSFWVDFEAPATITVR